MGLWPMWGHIWAQLGSKLRTRRAVSIGPPAAKGPKMAVFGMNTEFLSTAQCRAIEALMTARTLPDAAKMAQVAPRTLRRWMADDPFRAALAGAQSVLFENVVGRMTTATNQALDVLVETMTSGGPALKLRGALGLLAALPAMRQLADFEGRLSALESSAGDGA